MADTINYSSIIHWSAVFQMLPVIVVISLNIFFLVLWFRFLRNKLEGTTKRVWFGAQTIFLIITDLVIIMFFGLGSAPGLGALGAMFILAILFPGWALSVVVMLAIVSLFGVRKLLSTIGVDNTQKIYASDSVSTLLKVILGVVSGLVLILMITLGLDLFF